MSDRDELRDGEPNRATVALVSEQVKNIHLVMEKGFEGVQRQLEAVAGLPVAFASLLADHTTLRREVDSLQDAIEVVEATATRAATEAAKVSEQVQRNENELQRRNEWKHGPRLLAAVAAAAWLTDATLRLTGH